VRVKVLSQVAALFRREQNCKENITNRRKRNRNKRDKKKRQKEKKKNNGKIHALMKKEPRNTHWLGSDMKTS
jgi:hypothetical protein